MIQQPPPQGQPLPQQGPPPVTIDAVMGLLRDGAMRRFRIDIEVDSTITGDESQERQDRTQFIEATTKFIEAWGPIVAQQPLMAQLAGELLLFGTRAFRVGRSLEEVIEETVDKLEEQAAQPKQPPQPTPEEQVKLEIAKTKLAGEQSKAQAESQKAGLEMQGTQAKAKTEADKAQLDMFNAKIQSESQIQLAREKATMDKEAMLLDAEIKKRADERAHELHQTKLQHEREGHAHKLQQADQQHAHTLQKGEQELQKGKQDMTAAAEGHKQKVELTKVAGEAKAKAKTEPKAEKSEPKAEHNPVKDVVSILDSLGKANKPKKVIRDDSGKITGIE